MVKSGFVAAALSEPAPMPKQATPRVGMDRSGNLYM